MSILQELQQQANEVAAISADMTVAEKGGGGRLLPEGYAFIRLVEYIEFGNQPQEFQGKAKEPALEVQLGFALYGQGYQEEDGSPYILRPYRFAVKRNEKARGFLVFQALNWDNAATHYAQLLGKAWLGKVVNEPRSKTDQTLVSRLDLTSFLPPFDPVTKQPYQIPMPEDKYYRAFFWEKPTKAAWDSLYIDGKDDKGGSRNYIQDTIMSATDYEGSALQQLLGGGATLALPGAVADVQAPAVAQAQPAVNVAPVAPAVQTAGTPAQAAPEVAQPVAPLAQPAQAAVAPVQPIAPIMPNLPVTPV